MSIIIEIIIVKNIAPNTINTNLELKLIFKFYSILKRVKLLIITVRSVSILPLGGSRVVIPASKNKRLFKKNSNIKSTNYKAFKKAKAIMTINVSKQNYINSKKKEIYTGDNFDLILRKGMLFLP